MVLDLSYREHREYKERFPLTLDELRSSGRAYARPYCFLTGNRYNTVELKGVNMSQTITRTDLKGIKKFKSGKVRDVYDLGDKLLIVATDRISAFDFVIPTPIPDKGRILNQLSLFWFGYTKNIIDNHVVTADVKKYPKELQQFADILEGRSVIGRKAKLIDIECIVRGYISGSAWAEYQKTGMVSGIKLPAGLKESQKLPEPIFTPSTKASTGHDININEAEMRKLVGDKRTDIMKKATIDVYNAACKLAESKGIIIADTKFEYGEIDGKVILIDEILTPDSSRFWPMDGYMVGGSPKSYDKQFVRDYLMSIKWDKNPPAPALPEDVVKKTREKYLEAYEILSGKAL
jgi:phosphoribosylaminoimidazole-succinocarboxamide synthase